MQETFCSSSASEYTLHWQFDISADACICICSDVCSRQEGCQLAFVVLKQWFCLHAPVPPPPPPPPPPPHPPSSPALRLEAELEQDATWSTVQLGGLFDCVLHGRLHGCMPGLPTVASTHLLMLGAHFGPSRSRILHTLKNQET